jgi:hypothetical protein
MRRLEAIKAREAGEATSPATSEASRVQPPNDPTFEWKLSRPMTR